MMVMAVFSLPTTHGLDKIRIMGLEALSPMGLAEIRKLAGSNVMLTTATTLVIPSTMLTLSKHTKSVETNAVCLVLIARITAGVSEWTTPHQEQALTKDKILWTFPARPLKVLGHLLLNGQRE